MFGTARISPDLKAGSPLRVRKKDGSADGDVDEDDVVEAQRLRIVYMLLKGKMYGLPGSDGTRWGNFREWAKNQHPVLSMFCAHELHPFSKTERLSVMMCYLCWAFFITVCFEYGNLDDVEVCNAGCNNVYYGRVPESYYRKSYICGEGSGINEHKITEDEYYESCDSITPWWVLSFCIAAVTVPYSTILKFLATCACAQSLPPCLRGCIEFLGSLILKIFGMLSIIWLGVGISLSVELDGGLFLVTYLTGVVKSWMYWPILAGAMFTFKYKKHKRLFDEANPGQVAMVWPVDPHDPNLEVKVGSDNKPVVHVSPPGSPKTATTGQHPSIHDPNAGSTPIASPSPQPQFYGSGGGGQPMTMQQHPMMMQAQPMMMQYPGSPVMSPRPGMNNMDINPYGGGASAPQLQQPGTSIGYSVQQPLYGAPQAPPPGGAGGNTLPAGWEMKMQPDGRLLYIDHNTKSTHWNPPPMHETAMGAGACSGFPSPMDGPTPIYGGMQQQPIMNGCPGHMQQAFPVGGYSHDHLQQQQPPMVGYTGQLQQQQPPMGGYPSQMPQQSSSGGYPVLHQQHPLSGLPGQQMLHRPQQEVPAPAPAPKPIVLEFAVPDGVSAGDLVQINSPNGMVEVTIPAGSKSGDTLQIPLPG